MQGFYYSQLNIICQKAYEKIVRAINNRLNEVKTNIISSNDDFLNIIQAVRYEHPEFFFVDFNHLRYYKTPIGYVWQIGYLLNINVQRILESEIEKEATRIISNLNISAKNSEIKTIRSIHNYLVKNTTYDYEALSNPDAFPESFGIDGALCKKKAVCEGISKAFKYLCDKVGVNCLIASGKASLESIGQDLSHAWNIVTINNSFSHVDVTWDIEVSKLCRRNRYDYFCIPDSWISKDHVYVNTPQCTSYEFSYFYNKNLLFRNMNDLKSFLISELNKKSKVIYFKIIGNNLPYDVSNRINDLVKQLAASYLQVSYSYEIISNNEQNCYYFRFIY